MSLTSRPTVRAWPNGWRSFRASAASRRPASASSACMPIATCGLKPLPKSSLCRAGSNSSACRSRASRRSIHAISRRRSRNRRCRKERAMQREGSAFSGLGVVVLKELSDHLTSVRMRVLEWLVVLVALAALYGAIQQIKDTTAEDPFLFLRLFTTSRDPLPSFVSFLSFLVPLMAIGLGFDAVNGEYNRRTLSRILAQPIYRDARHQPDHAVAPGHGARPAADRHSARRRGDRPQPRLPARDHRLCRRLARLGAAVLDPIPLGGDCGAGHARVVVVPDLHLAGA